MLEVGKKRAAGIGFTSKDLSWKEGDAQELPFEDNTFDAYTISFGIRNVVDVQKVSTGLNLQIKQVINDVTLMLKIFEVGALIFK
jgi:hypothetical protein